MSTKKAYQEKMEAQLKEWSAKLDQLEAKAQRTSVDAKIQYQKQLEKVRKQTLEAQNKLQQLKDASDDAWENLKGGVESAWVDLTDSVNKAMRQFK